MVLHEIEAIQQRGNEKMSNTGTVLIIEDEEVYCQYYEKILTKQKYKSRAYTVKIALDLKTAEVELKRLMPDIVLLDLRFPPRYEPEEGLAFLKCITELYPIIKVIVITGAKDVEVALKAIEFGAYDFVQKNTGSYTELPFRVNQAYERLQFEREFTRMKRKHKR